MLAAEFARQRRRLPFQRRQGLEGGRGRRRPGCCGHSGGPQRRGGAPRASALPRAWQRLRGGRVGKRMGRLHQGSVPAFGGQVLASAHAGEGRRVKHVLPFAFRALLAHALDELGEREPDDGEPRQDDAGHDDARNHLAEQSEPHPGHARAHVAATCGQLLVVEERRKVVRVGRGREERQQDQHGKEDQGQPHRHAGGNPLAVEAHKEAHPDGQEQKRQQVGAQAQGQVQGGRQKRRDDGVGGQHGGHQKDGGQHGEHHAHDVMARALVEEARLLGRGGLAAQRRLPTGGSRCARLRRGRLLRLRCVCRS